LGTFPLFLPTAILGSKHQKGGTKILDSFDPSLVLSIFILVEKAFRLLDSDYTAAGSNAAGKI
jgi:hypothetical protein